MMNRVIVTGANGFIGSSMIKKMIENKVEVIALDKSFANCRLPNSELITKIEVDLNSSDLLINSIPARDTYECFYHLAWGGVNGPNKANPTVQTNNMAITLNCAKIAKESGCKKFLCAGTVAENAVFSLSRLDKTSGGMMYGVAKYCTRIMLENYCKNIGLDFVWMQFSNIYGPANKTGNLVSYTIDCISRGEEATFGPAEQMYDFIFVDDLIEAAYRLGKDKTTKSFYFIGSGKPRKLKDYLLEIGAICNKNNLIKIGMRDDDGIKYTAEMFSTNNLVKDIGNYVSKDFTEGIKYTIENY